MLGIKEENSSLQTARDELQERNSALKEQCLAQSKLVDERQEELERSSSEFEGMRTKVCVRTFRQRQFTSEYLSILSPHKSLSHGLFQIRHFQLELEEKSLEV